MRDLHRIDAILMRLAKVWKQYPDLRLGQLLLNCFSDPLLYYLEDDELIETLESYYLNLPEQIIDKELDKFV